MKLTGALLLTLASVGAAPSAHAEDTRPCVSVREFKAAHNVYLHARVPQRELEKRWEVRPVAVSDGIQGVMSYRRCGYSLNESWFGAAYNRYGYLYMLTIMKTSGATVHGHP